MREKMLRIRLVAIKDGPDALNDHVGWMPVCPHCGEQYQDGDCGTVVNLKKQCRALFILTCASCKKEGHIESPWSYVSD